MEHYASDCPSNTDPANIEGMPLLMMEEALEIDNKLEGDADYDISGEFSFLESTKSVNPHWILMDSQSTADIFCNPTLLTNIHTAKKSIKVHCNAGTIVVTQVGTLKNYGEVWFNRKGIANILSLAKVKERYPVRYDSEGGNQFIVVQPKKQVVFKQSSSGLYFHDTTNRAVVMVNTVSDNREGYTNRAFNEAKQARRALGMVGYPSEEDFKNIVSSNMIRNCPVTPENINAAKKNLRSQCRDFKRKNSPGQPPVRTEYVKIPKEIVDLNKDITITADMMFVGGLGFMITAARKIKFTTLKYVARRSKTNLINSL
jgi:hypothetical protein